MSEYVTKDSGERARFDSGMQRDTETGKARFDLTQPLGVPYEEQLLTRFANLMARGAEKYEERNWEKATGDAELARFKSSAFRHFMQWYSGQKDEDHAAAVLFNLMGFEATSYKMKHEEPEPEIKLGAYWYIDPAFQGPHSFPKRWITDYDSDLARQSRPLFRPDWGKVSLKTNPAGRHADWPVLTDAKSRADHPGLLAEYGFTYEPKHRADFD